MKKKSYCDFLTLTLTYLNPSLSQFRPSRQLLSIINIWILSLRKSSFQNVQLFLGKWRSVSSSCWSRIWVVEAIISGLLYATVFLEFIWTKVKIEEKEGKQTKLIKLSSQIDRINKDNSNEQFITMSILNFLLLN